jgi:hypothetical protein
MYANSGLKPVRSRRQIALLPVNFRRLALAGSATALITNPKTGSLFPALMKRRALQTPYRFIVPNMPRCRQARWETRRRRAVVPYATDILPGDLLVIGSKEWKLLNIQSSNVTTDEMQLAIEEVI